MGQPAVGRARVRLLKALKEAGHEVPEALEEKARTLDAHYMPARYPEAYPEGSPYEYYTRARAEEALRAAEGVLKCISERPRLPLGPPQPGPACSTRRGFLRGRPRDSGRACNGRLRCAPFLPRLRGPHGLLPSAP
ncbi:hypothetical protein CSW42_10180 [Thermus scotoductus]|nr:hypothetical protein CSW42_10180 [Thermus scotoductus]